MKFNIKTAAAGIATLALAGAGFLTALSAPAYAASPTGPAWVPDTIGNPAPYSGITFYDANGNVVTSGSDLTNVAAFAVGDSPFNSQTTHHAVSAGVSLAAPNHTLPTSNWAAGGATSNTTFPITTGPADIVADTTTPVFSASGANTLNVANFASDLTDTTSGYVNLVQVRMTDSGLGTGASSPAGVYWEADLAINTGATTATVVVNTTSGFTVSVPAGGWVQVFPLQTATTTTLTATPNGPQNNNTSIALSATVSPAENGTVQFFYGTTAVGAPVAVTTAASTATATDASEANVSSSYSAVFSPTVGAALATPNTATATQVDGDTSNAVPVAFSTPSTPTTNTVNASNLAPATFNAPVTLTDQVAESDGLTAGLAGTVQFLDNGSPFGSPQTTNASGLVTLATPPPNWQAGANNVITATYTPTSPAYHGGASSNSVTVVEPAQGVCAQSGSSCSEPQNITVTVNPGTITITTPYTSANPFVLPAMTLSSDGTFLQSSATFPATALPGSQQIVVTSSLAPAYAWTLSVAATPLTGVAHGATIPASGLGLTGGALVNATGPGAYPGTVTFANGATQGIAALNPSPVDAPGTGPGLSGTAQSWATSTAADGTAEMDGTLTLLASTSTPADTYNGTITFSVS